MGNWNSGRTPWAGNDTVEGAIALDASAAQKAGSFDHLANESESRFEFPRGRWISEFSIVRESCITKTFVVRVSRTACNYGGWRYWFHCPHCGHRFRLLYLAGRILGCRKCLGLVYETTRMNAFQRKESRAEKLLLKAGASQSDPPNFKPKGMHYETQSRLIFEAYSLRMEAIELVSTRIDRLTKDWDL